MKPRVKLPSEADALLGTCPDRVVAERYGVSVSQVFNRRVFLNIPPFKKTIERLTPALRADLGRLTDEQVARRHHLSRATVRHIRKVNSIPAYNAGVRVQICAILTREEKAEILALAEIEGVRPSEMAGRMLREALDARDTQKMLRRILTAAQIVGELGISPKEITAT